MQQILLFSRQKSRQLPKATIEEEKSAPLSETVSGTTFATAIETTSHNKSASLSSHRSFAVKAFIFTPTSLPPFRRREGEKQFCGVKMHRENAKIISMRVKTQNSSRTFRRRSRSWWIRSRRGHFFKVVRDETGVEIRVFVWWFYYVYGCVY
jgi:hypothetical protein